MDIELFTKPPSQRKRTPSPRWILAGLLVLAVVAVFIGSRIGSSPTPTPGLPSSVPAPTTTATPSFRLEGRLVFAASQRDPGDIYAVNLDDYSLVNLTRYPAVYENPTWSPDGTRIAFASTREGLQRIYWMQADGSQVTAVANTGPLDSLADWSPDGRWLLLGSHRDVNGEIYALNLDDHSLVNLTQHPAEDMTPAWSPPAGGTQIAFASDRESSGERRVKQIYRMNVDGTDVVRLTDFFYGASYPVWSPDGKYIACSVDRKILVGNLMEEDTYLMRADGSEPRLLVRQAGWTRPRCWSPDGRRLIVNHVWEADGQIRYETQILSPFDDTPAVVLPNEFASAGWGHRWRVAGRPIEPIPLSGATPTPVPPSAAIALVNGTLVDGTGAPPVPQAVVVIRNGRIAAAGPRTQIQVPADAQVVDVQGATILPGLINAHVHETYQAHNLATWVQAGVTTVRDMNAPALTTDGLQYVYAFRDAVLGHPRYARIVASSPIMTVPDGYGSLAVTSPEDARAKTAAILDAGADVIKISLEDTLGGPGPTLSLAEAQAIVTTAHARGVPVTVHVSRAWQLEVAVSAGVDDVAHMVVGDLSDDLIARMVAGDVYWVPTLELWNRAGMNDQVVDNLRRFVAAGGKVALGTDYGGSASIRFDPGLPIHELLYMQDAGMTPMQIVVAATRNAAHVCGRGDTLGTLEPGKVADILVVDGDPLADILAFQNVRLVLRDGVIVRR